MLPTYPWPRPTGDRHSSQKQLAPLVSVIRPRPFRNIDHYALCCHFGPRDPKSQPERSRTWLACSGQIKLGHMNLQCKLDRSETAGLVGVCCSCAPPKTPFGPIGAVGLCETCGSLFVFCAMLGPAVWSALWSFGWSVAVWLVCNRLAGPPCGRLGGPPCGRLVRPFVYA